MANTYFELLDRRLYIWTSPKRKNKEIKLIFFLGNRKWRNSYILAKARPDGNCSTGHELLETTIKIKIKKTIKVVSMHRNEIY